MPTNEPYTYIAYPYTATTKTYAYTAPDTIYTDTCQENKILNEVSDHYVSKDYFNKSMQKLLQDFSYLLRDIKNIDISEEDIMDILEDIRA